MLPRDSIIYQSLEKKAHRTAQGRLGAAADHSGPPCLEAWVNTLATPDSSPLVGRLTPEGWRENPSHCMSVTQFPAFVLKELEGQDC